MPAGEPLGAFPGLDAIPLTSQYTHYSLNKDGQPTYVTDSAAGGSATSKTTLSPQYNPPSP